MAGCDQTRTYTRLEQCDSSRDESAREESQSGDRERTIKQKRRYGIGNARLDMREQKLACRAHAPLAAGEPDGRRCRASRSGDDRGLARHTLEQGRAGRGCLAAARGGPDALAKLGWLGRADAELLHRRAEGVRRRELVQLCLQLLAPLGPAAALAEQRGEAALLFLHQAARLLGKGGEDLPDRVDVVRRERLAQLLVVRLGPLHRRAVRPSDGGALLDIGRHLEHLADGWPERLLLELVREPNRRVAVICVQLLERIERRV